MRAEDANWRERRHFHRLLVVGLLCMFFLAACRARDSATESIGVSMTGLDHLAGHLSVQDFWVDGHLAHQAGKGGSQVCCATLPLKWHSGLSVTVKWGVTNWRDHVYSMQERVVPVTQYVATIVMTSSREMAPKCVSARSPLRSVHVWNFSAIHAACPSGESTSA